MRSLVLRVCFILSALVSTAHAGFEYNENFTVFTPPEPTQADSENFAKQVILRAQQYRSQIALEWLGEELPPGVGKTTINVVFSQTTDSGLTWAKDDPRRRLHTVYLTTSPERALSTTLAHEMVHVVLATQFPHPNRLPSWLEEGIASRYDDEVRMAERQRIIDWFIRTGNWPRLEEVLFAESIRSNEPAEYAVAASVTDFLLSRANKQQLIAFGQQARTSSIEEALSRNFDMGTIDQLQSAWQSWLRQANRVAQSRSTTTNASAAGVTGPSHR